MGDHYELLGVARTATTEEIKKAFREKAKLYHPDLNPSGGEAGEQTFKELTEAHEVLQNPFKRSQYDSVSEMGRFTERTQSRGMTMEEYMEQHIKYWRDGRSSRQDFGAEQARRREAEQRWRQMQAESWEWEKRDAKVRQTQFRGQHERAEAERQKRSARILKRFWQTHRGVVWQDVAFMSCIGFATCVTASYWKAYLVAREERLEAREEASAQ